VEEYEQHYVTLHAMVETASQTMLRINKEPQSPAPPLREFLTSKRQEGWEVAGVAPSGDHLLLILKRPLASPP